MAWDPLTFSIILFLFPHCIIAAFSRIFVLTLTLFQVLIRLWRVFDDSYWLEKMRSSAYCFILPCGLFLVCCLSDCADSNRHWWSLITHFYWISVKKHILRISPLLNAFCFVLIPIVHVLPCIDGEFMCNEQIWYCSCTAAVWQRMFDHNCDHGIKWWKFHFVRFPECKVLINLARLCLIHFLCSLTRPCMVCLLIFHALFMWWYSDAYFFVSCGK